MADTNDLELNRSKKSTVKATLLATTRDPAGPVFVHMEDADNVHPNTEYDKDRASLSAKATLEPHATLDVSEDKPNSDIVGDKSTGQAITKDGETAEPPLSNEEQPEGSAEDAQNGQDEPKSPSTLEEQDGGAESDTSVEEEPSSQESEDDFKDRREVYDAVRRGDLESLKTTLANVSDVNRMWRKGQNVLHYACRQSERTDVIKFLLAQRVDAKSKTKDEYPTTALHLAAQYGSLSTVTLLLENNADIEATDFIGETPIFDSVRRNHPEIVEHLVTKRAKVDVTNDFGGTPLFYAFGNNDIGVAKILLNNNVAVNAVNSIGETALIQASQQGDKSGVELLLNKGASVDSPDRHGSTPLHYATAFGKCGVVEILLNRRAFPHTRNHYGQTPLHLAAESGQTEIATQLLEVPIQPEDDDDSKVPNLRADLDLADTDGQTPLHLAAKGSEDIVSLLLSRRADFRAKTNIGRTALHIAAAHGQEKIIEKLLRVGSRRGLLDDEKKTELHLLCQGFKEVESIKKVLKTLLEGKSDDKDYLESTDKEGETPLHAAYRSGNKALMEQLLEHKARPTPINKGKDKSKDKVSVIGQAIRDIELQKKSIGTEDLENKEFEEKKPEGEGLENEEPEKHGDIEMVQILLKGCPEEIGGEKVEEREQAAEWLVDKVKRTDKLYRAVSGESINEAMVKALLNLDVEFNVEKKDEQGRTMLHHLVKKGKVELIKLLIETQDADTEAKTLANGLTPLLLATKYGHKDAMEALLNKGADIEATTESGQTALHMAVLFPSDDILAEGARDQGKGIENDEPAKKGMKGKKIEATEKGEKRKDGIEKGEKRKDDPRTPAANAKEMVRLLLKFGADLDTKDRDGYTAWKLARKNAKKEYEKIFGDPPVIIQREPSTRVVQSPQDLNTNKKEEKEEKDICWNFDALVMDFYEPVNHNNQSKEEQKADTEKVERNQKEYPDGPTTPAPPKINKLQRIRKMYELIYRGPKAVMKKPYQDMLKELNSTSEDHYHRMRWIHIPANNMYNGEREHDVGQVNDPPGSGHQEKRSRIAIYVPYLNFEPHSSRVEIQKTLKAMDAQKKSKDSTNSTSTTTDEPSRLECQTRATTSAGSGKIISAGTEPISIDKSAPIVPTEPSQLSPQDINRDPKRVDERAASKSPQWSSREKCEALLRRYSAHPRGFLHMHRTLDQFYYDSVDTEYRDKSQVLYRYSLRKSTELANAPVAKALKHDSLKSPNESHPKDSKHDTAKSNTPATSKEGTEEPQSSSETRAPSYSDNPVIFTVDQLWIWIIDDKTIISSFPERWAEDEFRELKVLDSIKMYLRQKGRRQVSNAHEMAALIMSICLRFVDKCYVRKKNGQVIESFFEAFASEVRRVVSCVFSSLTKFSCLRTEIAKANKEARLFRNFKREVKKETKEKQDNSERGKLGGKSQDASEERNTVTKMESGEEDESEIEDDSDEEEDNRKKDQATDNPTGKPIKRPKQEPTKKATGKPTKPETSTEGLNILREIIMLKNIRDIRDELNILRKILEEQKYVIEKAFGEQGGLELTKEARTYYLERSGIYSRIDAVDKMKEDAATTYEQLKALLDLKQKGANLKEAEAAARQGEEASQHSKQAARQSALLLIFTLVTVFFLPLSFLTSLFALNINIFPKLPIPGAEPGNDQYDSMFIFPVIFLVSFSAMLVIFMGALFYISPKQSRKFIREIGLKSRELISKILTSIHSTYEVSDARPDTLTKHRPKSTGSSETDAEKPPVPKPDSKWRRSFRSRRRKKEIAIDKV
ncbi:MAG: hypothetical protein Q9187_003841 [Circinaria calcarea]